MQRTLSFCGVCEMAIRDATAIAAVASAPPKRLNRDSLFSPGTR
jgi:hypothetical protein